MNDFAFILLALAIGVVMRTVQPKSGLSVMAMRVAAVILIAVIWLILRLVDFPVTMIAGLVAAGAVVVMLHSPRPDKITLRCSGCGNYYPSRDHFATAQLCKTCHEALGSAVP